MRLFAVPKRVAVIEMQGTIGRGVRGAVHLPLLDRARKSPAVGAVVLSIDSPGGSASASEEVYLGVSRVAEVKPVVACIQGSGTSGAYYIASAANKIVAVRNALVGSIGVIFAQPIAEQLFQKLGIAFSIQKTGAHKDMFGPWRMPTSEENQKLQSLMDEVFTRFIQVVAAGRHLEEAKVRELATGEVFTSQRALTLGLIDELGDLDSAIDTAAGLAKIKRRVAYLRPPRRRFSILRAAFGQDLVYSFMEEVELGLQPKLWL